jgi:deoxyribodipyrimidine photo-lyase
VTRLSPYLSHGFLSLVDVLAALHARRPLDTQHKLVYELGWRAYFHHVWQHRGEGIFESLHEGPLPEAAYHRELPEDLAEGRTGVPAIDQAVAELLATGWLHNHARMWLASYTVHVRKLHWRVGADWMWGHLLDGDLASNHLSWQWVAGTGSHKPYLFNADNVARYAPAEWHSPGSVVDTSYEALDRMARSGGGGRVGSRGTLTAEHESQGHHRLGTAPPAGVAQRFAAPDAQAVQGRDVWLMHPWHLAAPPSGFDGLVLGVLPTLEGPAQAWSDARWHFVASRLEAACSLRWKGRAAEMAAALSGATRVRGSDNAHLAPALRGLGLAAPAALFDDPGRVCGSFSQYWNRVTRGMKDSGDILRAAGADLGQPVQHDLFSTPTDKHSPP